MRKFILKLSIFLFFLVVTSVINGANMSWVLAQSANPLSSNKPDPLLPPASLNRPLTPLEIRIITAETIKLNQQANNLLAAGNEAEAFTIWYRELRLQRAIGKLAEIKALARVGEIAWSNNRSQDLRNINQRLVTIQQEITNSSEPDLQLLSSLGLAYQQVKDVDRAIAIYQQLIKSPDNLNDRPNILDTLAELYLAKFSYLQAAEIYEKLLNSSARQLPENQLFYLEKLANIYDSASQPAKAITIKEKLAQQYLATQKIEELTKLKISLAQDYQSLGKFNLATKNYQEAINLATSLQQFALVSEAWQKLGNLYDQTNQTQKALSAYQELLKIEQKAYNFYGLMNVYDRLGQIHRKSNNYSQALKAFQQGLNLANSLNYRIDYFNNQINQLNQNLKSNI